ncbi:TetR/AcrR family transcriptional regulator C-terminal domain-containing protein [Streptomyces sp. NPDC101152]|uniref:TetR/AcrR family transcriptional regulator C-terminal domain-containing protein n=1 Tax=Streptomyces sp. NPDC101152 TaxID=3366116 RepID=UPI00380D5667
MHPSLAVPALLRAVRSALTGFAELGPEPGEMVYALRACTAFVVGSIMRGLLLTVGAMGPERVRERVAEITAPGDPLLTSIAPYLAVSDADAEFEDGLELLIDGLAVRIGNSGRRVTGSR